MEYNRQLIDKNKYRESILTIMRCWNISPCLSPEEARKSVRNLQTALDVLKDEPIVNAKEIIDAEWKMVVDDFDDGLGNRELPHCTNCGRGVYRHDAGSWCTFCGAAMKNPIRL